MFSDHAEFHAKDGSYVSISDVQSVAKGWKNQVHGEPLLRGVDTYIEIIWGDPADPNVAFVNDSRWFGLATYLSHKELQRALSDLMRMP